MPKKIKKGEVFAVLHDLRSVLNVGSIFRTADSIGVDKIFLTGTTPTPIDRFGQVRSDFKKTSLGADQFLEWEYKKRTEDVLGSLRKSGFKIIAIEQSKNSIDYKKIKKSKKTAFVLGNEVGGIPEKILSKCDLVAEIPHKGGKESLNVSVAFGIVLFRVLDH